MQSIFAAQSGGERGWVPRTEPYSCPACGHRSYRGKILSNHLQKCCPDLITSQASAHYLLPIICLERSLVVP